MQKNKFTTYLLYAVGEIVLVVIGILIAVNINDWNTNRKERETERKILLEIKQDLERNHEEVQANIKSQFQGFEHAKRLYESVQEKKCDSAAVFALLLGAHDRQFYPKASGYEALKAEGLNIIMNDSIRQGITNLYELSFPKIVKRGFYENQVENPMLMSRAVTDRHISLTRGIDFTIAMNDTLFYTQKIPSIKNCEAFLQDPEVVGLAAELSNTRSNFLSVFHEVDQEILSVLSLIERFEKKSR